LINSSSLVINKAVSVFVIADPLLFVEPTADFSAWPHPYAGSAVVVGINQHHASGFKRTAPLLHRSPLGIAAIDLDLDGAGANVGTWGVSGWPLLPHLGG